MSMINEQIKRLREKADTFERAGSAVDGIVKEFRQAADTIEELSAKLHNANMERSTAYYNDGWIPVSEKYPTDENKRYLVCYEDGCITIEYLYFDGAGYPFFSEMELGVIAWMPLPKPFEGNTK